MLVAGYHKGFSKTERLKVIHRFLPREVSALVIYYLWLVLPF
jgi:superfamily II DNA helicase RecQ